MKAQRDKLIAAKKKEREAKVEAENERMGRAQQSQKSSVCCTCDVFVRYL